MTGTAFLFFAVFALILIWMYLAIRRRWGRPATVAGVGIFGAVIAMMMVSLTQQDNSPIQALFVGIVIGGLFSGATLIVAWYFSSNETREAHRKAAQEMMLQDQTDSPS